MGRSKMKIKTVEMVSRLQEGHTGTRMSPLPTPYSSSHSSLWKKVTCYRPQTHGVSQSVSSAPSQQPNNSEHSEAPNHTPPVINLLHHSGMEPRFVKELDKAFLVLRNSTTPVYILVLIYCMCYCLSHIYKSIRINQAIKSHQEFP